MYSPAKFGKMIGKSVKTLQRWDSEGTLTARRNPKNRRYYTHDQYLEYIGIKADDISCNCSYSIGKTTLPDQRK